MLWQLFSHCFDGPNLLFLWGWEPYLLFLYRLREIDMMDCAEKQEVEGKIWWGNMPLTSTKNSNGKLMCLNKDAYIISNHLHQCNELTGCFCYKKIISPLSSIYVRMHTRQKIVQLFCWFAQPSSTSIFSKSLNFCSLICMCMIFWWRDGLEGLRSTHFHIVRETIVYISGALGTRDCHRYVTHHDYWKRCRQIKINKFSPRQLTGEWIWRLPTPQVHCWVKPQTQIYCFHDQAAYCNKGLKILLNISRNKDLRCPFRDWFIRLDGKKTW
jgi:hypothetical protein